MEYLFASLAILLIVYLVTITRKNKRDRVEPKSATLEYEPLISYAEEIGFSHQVMEGKDNIGFLLDRMNDNYKYILTAYRKLTDIVNENGKISGADEWLLDNFYIIEEQTKELRLNVMKKNYDRLPAIKEGKYQGYPRVFAVALELVSHTDSVLHQQLIIDFIERYQRVSYLTDAEIWAISTMLRIALMENIRLLCRQMMRSHNQIEKADEVSEGLLKSNEKYVEVLKGYFKQSIAENSSFFERLIATLRKSKEGERSIKLIDRRFRKIDKDINYIISIEHQKQAARQVSIGNTITSLRFIMAIDYTEIFGKLSQVERVLNEDPIGIYGTMDAASKYFYRKQVQRLAKKLDISEVEVARRAVELAQLGNGEMERHIGYYLLFQNLEKSKSRKKQVYKKIYFFSTILLTLAICSLLCWFGVWATGSYGMALLILVLTMMPASDISIHIINYIVTHLAKPWVMPRIELDEGIPEECATFVVISALLTSEEGAKQLVDRLEVYYLANKDENLYFGLLSDFADSVEKEQPQDKKILKVVTQMIEELNQKYAEGGQLFFLLHRKRIYDEKSKKYMGYERKRGAIVELNRLLRGETNTTFDRVIGNLNEIPKIKYVITLDADTVIGRGTAKELIGAMHHPLNKPVIDRKIGRVVSGYGLMQPRINVDITSANISKFSQIFAGQGGIDVYSGAISDIYQDMFGEGIFTGKGIFDVDVFNELLSHTIPENTVLSHDLLEGCYIRCGLISDVYFTDGFPWRYNSYQSRQHRWIRGDWQLLPWLRSKSVLSGISKWKIIDNLRRSLVPIALATILLMAFNLLPGNSWIWVGFSIVSLCFALLISTIEWTFSSGYQYLEQKFHATIIYGIKGVIYQAVLLFVLLPYNAYISLDAILRTLWRVIVSKNNMLEWVTAADADRRSKNGITNFYTKMISAVIYGIIVVLLAGKHQILASVLALLWIASPLVAYFISKPIQHKQVDINEEDEKLLRLLARRTWQYFEDFVTATGNYLAPDNFQESPPNGVAYRTSPTNIGLHLISIQAAYDFGFITKERLIEYLERTLASIDRLDKWKGHLYNWYNIKTMEVMRPRYISTVDSGNFVGYLITLKEALKELKGTPNLDKKLVLGLLDVVKLAEVEPTEELKRLISVESVNVKTWSQALDSIQERLNGNNTQWGLTAFGNIDDYRRAVNKTELDERLDSLITRIEKMIEDTNFAPLFDQKRELMSIGYNVEEEALTKSYYDLLASEARQASYIAIAKGVVNKKHWFTLGRTLVSRDGYRGLVSWTGTMFEYLMPLLLMKNIPNTLLDETYHFVIQRQRKYGKYRGVPWGTSESGYNTFDINLNYQYKAFGVPDLGLKRGLISDMVVAPYATIMALMVDFEAAMENIKRMYKMGVYGYFGFYEAIDFTPERILPNQKYSIVKSYMVHHLGMSMLAFDNVIHDNIIQKRFHRDVSMKSAEELLGERVPTNVIVSKENREKVAPLVPIIQDEEIFLRNIEKIDRNEPKMHALSNGRYSVVLADNGCGYSKYQNIMISRWRNDLQNGIYGNFIYIKDITNDRWWTTTLAPAFDTDSQYRTVFSPHKAEFYRTSDDRIDTTTDIIVSPEENAEIRRLSIANHSENEVILEVTSFQEIVLTNFGADLAHPAFSNLFVRTEYLGASDSLLASRRPREEGEPTHFALHTVSVQGEVIGNTEFETDRSKFLSRFGTAVDPGGVTTNMQSENTTGAVLDPCFALKKRLKLEPGSVTHLVYITAFCEDREEAETIANKYKDYGNTARAFDMAWTRSQIENKYLNISAQAEEDAYAILPHLTYILPKHRETEEAISKNTLGQQNLWPYGISGDNPIVTVQVFGVDQLDIVSSVIAAHELWRFKGVMVDVVLLGEDTDSYTQPLIASLRELLAGTHARELQGVSGGIFILSSGILSPEEKTLLYAVSRIVIRSDLGSIGNQIETKNEVKLPPLKEFTNEVHESDQVVTVGELDYYNGYGGFSNDEYIIYHKEDMVTPLPWINVISNHRFGFIISESGGGYVWSVNSRENKLTPWSNDSVADSLHEVIYFRDESGGKVWTPTPMPLKSNKPYAIKHGLGYTSFSHIDNGIQSDMTVFVPTQSSVKITKIELENLTDQEREISLTYYTNPVLGVSPHETRQFIKTDMNEEIMLITNSYNREFADRTAFIASSVQVQSYTGNAREFFGNARGKEIPECLLREDLTCTAGAGYEPCAVIRMVVKLSPKGKKELSILFGQGTGIDEIKETVAKYRDVANVTEALEESNCWWKQTVGSIIVKTPDKSMDIMLNGWLMYQTLSCRIWGRSAFYQSGGAIGFRDQLQDVMALLNTHPDIARNQILQACCHQYTDGDVQHWWHPINGEDKMQTNKGVRTKFSDDLLWLPFVVAEYIQTTEDYDVLDVELGYIEDEPLRENECERYAMPRISHDSGSVFDHCCRAIERSMKLGAHGIPLMGSGDWNDGMSTVGHQGKGESVWLGWFLYSVLLEFSDLCDRKGDEDRATRYRDHAALIAKNIDQNAWDGAWYRRAYFDDGTPLGSSQNTECKIDSISQSWAVISGAGDKDKVHQAMDSVMKYLVSKDDGLIKLLMPPFDSGDLKPGYIKSYVPGVRENGGQYTHASTWVVLAFTKLGMGDVAMELFSMINPIHHTRTPIEVAKYKTEPYVVAADVYAAPGHTGRGGWTWYTGAAGWLYRVALEGILGLERRGTRLLINPCIPSGWKEYSIEYLYGSTKYNILVQNPNGTGHGDKRTFVDNNEVEDIILTDDGKEHIVSIDLL